MAYDVYVSALRMLMPLVINAGLLATASNDKANADCHEEL